MERIAVIGATGMMGKPVTEELVNAGFKVTALVRNIEKAEKVLPKSIHYVKGDLQDLNAIREALKHAEAVYISIANTYKDKEDQFNAEQHGLDNVLKIAQELKIKQIGFLSSFLARNYPGDWWIYKTKKSSISRVKESGIPYTIFYASNFMENFPSGMLRGTSVSTVKSKLNNKSFWISGTDFGKQVANAFKTELSFNREYPVQGPQDFTMEEVANEFAKNYTKEKLKVSQTPQGLMKFLGLFSPMIKFMSRLSAVNLNNHEIFEAEKTWTELGKPETTIALFAKNYSKK